MFVLESSGPDAWASSYALKSTLDTFDQFAIDGTYFHHADQLYHIYSCWEDTYSAWPANLCITRMSDPLTINSTLSDRAIISVPDEPWEQVPRGRPVRLASNEGPQQLVNPHTGQNFVVYSAARVDTPFYCLGLLELVGDDPMLPCSWRKHRDGCVFQKNPDAGVYGTGHASFTVSPDGTEHYVVYHAQTTDQPTGMTFFLFLSSPFPVHLNLLLCYWDSLGTDQYSKPLPYYSNAKVYLGREWRTDLPSRVEWAF